MLRASERFSTSAGQGRAARAWASRAVVVRVVATLENSRKVDRSSDTAEPLLHPISIMRAIPSQWIRRVPSGRGYADARNSRSSFRLIIARRPPLAAQLGRFARIRTALASEWGFRD